MKSSLIALLLLLSPAYAAAQTDDGNGEKPPRNKRSSLPASQPAQPDSPKPKDPSDGQRSSGLDANSVRAQYERDLLNWLKQRSRSKE